MKIRSSIALFLAAGLGAGCALAQAPEEDLAKELEALLNAPVQGASKRQQRLIDSPQSIEVLTGDEIRTMGIYRLVDALRLMTSVDVLELNNHVTNISLRGAMQQGQPRNVQILVDGVPLYNAELAAVDIDNLPVPIDLIDKVEVVRGPSSSLYGANAVVGVIAITTRKAGEGTSGGVRGSRANLGTSRGAADLALGTKDLGLTLGYQGASLGVSHELTSDLNTGQPVLLDQDSSHQNQVFARGAWKAGNTTVWASAGAARKAVGSYAAVGYPFQTFLTQTMNAGWSQAWAPEFRTEVRASNLVQKDSFGPSPDLAVILNDPAYAAGTTEWAKIGTNLIEFQFNWAPAKILNLVGGLDHRTASTDPSLLIGFPATVKDSASGGFLNADWNVTGSFTLSAGARAENDSLGGSRTSPRVVALWNPTPNSSLRAGYYSSSRSPQVGESGVNFTNTFAINPASLGLPADTPIQGVFQILTNPQLGPEKVTSTEVGYRQIIETVSVDLTVFSMTFSNLIAQASAPVTPNPNIVVGPTGVTVFALNQYLNTAGATDKGVELAVNWRPSVAWAYGLNGTWLNYKLDAFAGMPATTPSYTPSFKGNLWTRFTQGAFSGYAGYNHVGRVNMDVLSIQGTSSPEVPRAAVDQVSCNLGWRFLPGATVALYALNALKAFTPQGAGGPARTSFIQGERREEGLTLSYRF